MAGTAFFKLAGPLSPPGQLALTSLLAPLFVLAALYFLLNSWLIAAALAFEQRRNIAKLWWSNFPWFSLNYFGGVSAAALLVSYTRSIDLGAISIILPLLAISYLTYRTSLDRVQDAQQHVSQINDLYLSTIETLAMAVDAKDQITHGHIRRVQVYALELAHRLGVLDEYQLKAIEAAALLHDMGKLAIPEHILNKPGKLSDAEFETMKRHADIGADLLSSIKFPYPVVPIVRHHHEHWDGHGYPSAIAGTDIPLGARILSVVDCFDALTSDRPYRPRLSADEAFAILRDRRGSMYDPLVVDTFISCYSEIAPMAIQAGHEARTLFASIGNDFAKRTSPLDRITATASTTSLLVECTGRLAKTAPADVIAVASEYARQLTPATVVAFLSYDSRIDAIRCESSYGDPSGYLAQLTIPLGQRISGWVAANRRVSVNSDAYLDLVQIAGKFTPPLRSTLALPLQYSDRLIGVLTLYSPSPDVFSEEHQYTVEQIGHSAAFALGNYTAQQRYTILPFRAQDTV